MSKQTRPGRAGAEQRRFEPPAQDLGSCVDPLHERGLKQQAVRLKRFLSLRSTGLPCATLLAGRLAPSLGGTRLGDALVLRAARRGGSPEARYYAARALFRRAGPIVTWLRIREWSDELGPHAPRHLRARWLALRASVAAAFRDFGAAERLLAAADVLAPGLPGVWTARAEVLIQQDRRAEALAAVRHALRRKPWHVDAVLTAADLMLTLGLGREACNLLLDAAVDSEDSRLMLKLAEHLAEQRRFRECLEWLERYAAASPLADREGRGLAAALGSRASDEVGKPRWHGSNRAARARAPRRVLLPVAFVQQDRFSCSPATLTELAAYWRRPVRQSDVAETICYDGTPRHRARGWAEQQGFLVREFRVTWQSARDVLDRGVPFAMVTQWGMAGHDQAVVGYDEARGSLMIRCPSQPILVEVSAQAFLATQAWCGPRGTALLPEAERARLDGLVLPDGEGYDHLHAIETALAEHRRDGAAALAASLARQQPGSRLNLWAALEIARYDSDHVAMRRSVEALLQVFPGTAALELWRLHALSSLVSPEAYERMLAAACRSYPRDLALRSLLAYQLSRYPDRAERARSTLWPVLRRGHWPTLALDLITLANIRDSHAFEESQALVTLAAHAGDLQEWSALAYFEKASLTDGASDALAFLSARFEAYARQSGEPAQTLYTALRSSGDEGGAVAVLERGVVASARRPRAPAVRGTGLRQSWRSRTRGAPAGRLARAHSPRPVAARGRRRRRESWGQPRLAAALAGGAGRRAGGRRRPPGRRAAAPVPGRRAGGRRSPAKGAESLPRPLLPGSARVPGSECGGAAAFAEGCFSQRVRNSSTTGRATASCSAVKPCWAPGTSSRLVCRPSAASASCISRLCSVGTRVSWSPCTSRTAGVTSDATLWSGERGAVPPGSQTAWT